MRLPYWLSPAIVGALAVPAFGLPDSWLGAVPQPLTFLLPLSSLAWLFHRLNHGDHSGQSGHSAALRIGYAWGMGFFLAGVSWIYVSLSQFSGLPSGAAALAALVFCAFFSLYPALAALGFAYLRHPGSTAKNALYFAAIWSGSEWLRGTLFTGFPWLSLGYSQLSPSPFSGYASVLGVYGVGFMSALSATLLLARSRLALISSAVLVGIGVVLSAMPWTTPIGEPLTVRLLQGNVAQAVKWQPEQLERSISTYLGLLNQADKPDGPVLNILPETAIPLLYEHIPQEILSALTAHGPTLLGVAVRTHPPTPLQNHAEEGYANAAIALDSTNLEQPLGMYAKRHLVPFGEFSPPGLNWFFRLLRIPMADFTPGPAGQPAIAIAGQRIAPNICYEDVFGEELLPSVRDATLLINLSNTAWFGDSLAQPQHLQIARMRALETGRSMLRATNSGMTAMILPDGQVAARLAPFSTGVLTVQAQGYSGLTPYAKWGNTLILLMIGSVVLHAAWRRHQGKLA